VSNLAVFKQSKISVFPFFALDHHSPPTWFQDYMSIVPERYEHEVFKKMSLENSNSKFVTTTA
jgi:hypothetical protein